MREIVRQKQRKTSLSSTGTKIIIYTILGLAAVTTIFPYLWMVLASLKTGIEISTYPEQIFPKNPSFTAYRRAFEELNLWVGIKNTLVLVVFAVLFPPVVSAMGAFSFAKLVLPAKRVLLLVLLSSMMVPYAALMLPQYQIWQSLGFVGTLWPLIIPNFFGGALMTFFFIQYMQGVPTDLFEAAKIDGAGYFSSLFHITLPMSTPILFYSAVTSMIGGLQIFGTYANYGAGVDDSLNFIVVRIYRIAFDSVSEPGGTQGLACAMSWILFLIIGLLTLLMFKLGGWVQYGEDS